MQRSGGGGGKRDFCNPIRVTKLKTTKNKFWSPFEDFTKNLSPKNYQLYGIMISVCMHGPTLKFYFMILSHLQTFGSICQKRKQPAVDSLSLSVHEHQILALLGTRVCVCAQHASLCMWGGGGGGGAGGSTGGLVVGTPVYNTSGCEIDP